MKPYGQGKKLSANFPDHHPHPKRLYVNWWEVEICPVTSKKRARQNAREDIKKRIEEEL